MRFKLTNYEFCGEDGWVVSTFEVESPTAEQGERMVKKALSKLMRNYPAGQLFVVPDPQALQMPWINTMPGVAPGVGQAPWNNGQWQQGSILVGGTVPLTTTTGPLGQVTVTVPGDWQLNGSNAVGGLVTNNGTATLQPGDTVTLSGFQNANMNQTYMVTNSSGSAMTLTGAQCLVESPAG